jgi:uncharacterized protein (DUF1697 family)
VSSRVLLLRAINVGDRRLAMPALRELLTHAGLRDVRTYLQSGNVVLSSDAPPERLAAQCRALISERAGFDVPVIVRTGEDLERVVAHDPFAGTATEPKYYWVTFFEAEPGDAALERLRALAVQGEQVVVDGREIYAWLPRGAGRSKLAAKLHVPLRELSGTARNWRTVTALLDMCAAG